MLEQEFGPSLESGPADVRDERQAPQWWCCRLCGQQLARVTDQMSFDGSHQHRFINPHGFEFYIRLFAGAPGVTATGESTDHFSWFVGYAWQIGYCRKCQAHLGWTFKSIGAPGPGEPADFTGLVTNQIELTDDKSS